MASTPEPIPSRPLSSLATKVILVVFLSTFLTAIVVSWTSVHSTYVFLERSIDRNHPALARRVADRIAIAREEARLEAESHSRAGRADPAGSFDLWLRVDIAGELIDREGRLAGPVGAVISAALAKAPMGDEAELFQFTPRDASTRVGAILRSHDDEGRAGFRIGLLRSSHWEDILGDEGLPPEASLLLVDREGRAVVGSLQGRLPMEELHRGGVVDWRDSAGVRRLVALAPGGEGLFVLIEEPFAAAFEPVVSVVTQILVIDLCIVLLFSLLAYQLTAAIVQPIEALSEGARRISRGELDVELPESDSEDEIGLLTRTFREMTEALARQRLEIEDSHETLLSRNEELRSANEVLEQLSITDGLTKLHNHRFFQDHLTREIKRVDRTDEPLAMLMCDLDDFKRLNDRLGHAAGDELLVGVARVLDDSIRESDFLARYGGEEFVVLAPNTDIDGAIALAEKVRHSVAETSFLLDASNQLTKVTLSIGVAMYQGHRRAFFRSADQALYRAKAAGKNCVIAEPGDTESAPDALPEVPT